MDAPMRDRRAEALLSALGRDTTSRRRLLLMHPDGPTLAEREAHVAEPKDVLWAELHELERRAGVVGPAGPERGDAVEYFVRRRRLGRVWRRAHTSSRLPPLWASLVAMPGAAANEACVELGLRLIAAAASSLELDRIGAWLAPLGREMTERVVRIAAAHELSGADSVFAGICRLSYEQACGERRGKRLASGIGRNALASLHRRLPAATREDVRRVVASRLCEKLDAAAPLPLPRAADADLVARWAERIARGTSPEEQR